MSTAKSAIASFMVATTAATGFTACTSTPGLAGQAKAAPAASRYRLPDKAVADITPTKARWACSLLGALVAKPAIHIAYGSDGTKAFEGACAIMEQLDSIAPLKTTSGQEVSRFDYLVELIPQMLTRPDGFGHQNVEALIRTVKVLGAGLTQEQADALEAAAQQAQQNMGITNLQLNSNFAQPLVASGPR
ncbi:MAG: hypothetical protein H6922_02080 [Pseudomonadaceae bacterium]|nr:hypothetical protein [Pseudomonadaceae bacterium]